jgi:hypothetical protein
MNWGKLGPTFTLRAVTMACRMLGNEIEDLADSNC